MPVYPAGQLHSPLMWWQGCPAGQRHSRRQPRPNVPGLHAAPYSTHYSTGCRHKNMSQHKNRHFPEMRQYIIFCAKLCKLVWKVSCQRVQCFISNVTPKWWKCKLQSIRTNFSTELTSNLLNHRVPAWLVASSEAENFGLEVTLVSRINISVLHCVP